MFFFFVFFIFCFWIYGALLSAPVAPQPNVCVVRTGLLYNQARINVHVNVHWGCVACIDCFGAAYKKPRTPVLAWTLSMSDPLEHNSFPSSPDALLHILTESCA